MRSTGIFHVEDDYGESGENNGIDSQSSGWNLTLRNLGCPPHLPDSCGSAQFGVRVVIECDAFNCNQSIQGGYLRLYSEEGSTSTLLQVTNANPESGFLHLVYEYSTPPAPSLNDSDSGLLKPKTHPVDDFLCELTYPDDKILISSSQLFIRYGCTPTCTAQYSKLHHFCQLIKTIKEF